MASNVRIARSQSLGTELRGASTVERERRVNRRSEDSGFNFVLPESFLPSGNTLPVRIATGNVIELQARSDLGDLRVSLEKITKVRENVHRALFNGNNIVASPLVVYESDEVVFRGCRGARAVGERGATAAGPGDS
jgi:hypothetical protein